MPCACARILMSSFCITIARHFPANFAGEMQIPPCFQGLSIWV